MKTNALLSLIFALFCFTNTLTAQLFGPQFTACVLKAPEKRLENVQKLAIMEFENNSSYRLKKLGPQLGNRLPDYMIAELTKEYRGAREDKIYMAKVRTNVFSLIERNEIDRILDEQGFNVSGAVDEDNAVEIGKLLGVDALIFGDFTYSSGDETYTTSREKKDGTTVTTYWRKRTVNVSSRMKIVSVKTGEILAVHSASSKEEATSSSQKGYPSETTVKSIDKLAGEGLQAVANQFVDFFSPKYDNKVFDLRKIKYKEFRDEAKEAQRYLKDGDVDKAYAIFKAFYEKDSYNPILAYNIGSIHAAVGNYMKAKEYYDIAYQLDGDTKAFKDAATEAAKYTELLADFSAVGIEIPQYVFDVDNVVTNANQVEVQGNQKDRIAIYAESSKKSEVVARVPGGVDLEIIEVMKGWFKVKLIGGKEGFLPETDGKTK